MTPEQIFEKIAEEHLNKVRRFCPDYQAEDLVKSAVIETCRLLYPLIDQWIPVRERLPDAPGEYYVFTHLGNGQTARVAANYHDEQFRLAVYLGAPLKLNVTHWQPLPEPPGSVRD